MSARHRTPTPSINSTNYFLSPNLPSGPCTRKAIVVDVDMTNRVVASQIVPCKAMAKNLPKRAPNSRA